MAGAATFENPDGTPLLRKVIRVPFEGASSQVYVVSMGNGPSSVLITSRSPGTSSRTS